MPPPDFAPFFVDWLKTKREDNENTPEGIGGASREIEVAEASGFEPAQ